MATAADRETYQQSIAELAALPAEQTGLVLAAVVRMLLEEQHGGGLDGDDIREVLVRCRADAGSWLPATSVSSTVLIAVLSSALGIHEAGVTYTELLPPEATEVEWVDPEGSGGPAAAVDGARPPSAAEYAWHAPLLIASLLRAGRGRLDRCLDAAFAEVARAETMEMP
jgi:hypothetical protein